MKLIMENWRKYLKEGSDYDWDSFGFSDEERGEETKPDPHYEDLTALDRGDTFTIGNRKPVYRITGAPAESGKVKGVPIKTAVIEGSGERKYYIIRRAGNDSSAAVGAYEAIGGGTDHVKEPRRGKTGFVMNIKKALDNK
jgi:single-stranded DNA-specific DHH superfamily exonuclease